MAVPLRNSCSKHRHWHIRYDTNYSFSRMLLTHQQQGNHLTVSLVILESIRTQPYSVFQQCWQMLCNGFVGPFISSLCLSFLICKMVITVPFSECDCENAIKDAKHLIWGPTHRGCAETATYKNIKRTISDRWSERLVQWVSHMMTNQSGFCQDSPDWGWGSRILWMSQPLA